MIKSDDALKKDKKNLLPYFTQNGVDREGDGDQYLANLRHGSWCAFKYFAFDGMESKLTITVSGSAEGTMKVYTDRTLPAVAALAVMPSDTWTSYAGSFNVKAGTMPLYFVYEGSGSLNFQTFIVE